MTNFFAELKRRQMFRVAAAYAVVAWVLLQLVNNIAPALRLPDWAATLVLVLLVVGFPVALLFCWIQQLAPAGGDSKATTGKLDWMLIGALIVVIGLVSYQQLAPNGGTTAQQPGVEAAKAAAASSAGAISLAVLPFANMSGDATQEFFSDGITEEITSALVKIPDLRVVARTSAFEFKNQNRNIQSIGQQLNATHLIEGSVRKAGERVRITVQLIKADDGTQIWSENYDRELTDIFAIQEEIGRAIATSFNMRIGLAPGERLVSDRAKDQETYDLYLRGRALYRSRGPGVQQALELLEQVVARDPNFAPGWAWLSQVRGNEALFFSRSGDESKLGTIRESAESAARKAIELAPEYSGGYAALGLVTANRRGTWMEVIDLYKKGLAIDSNDPELLNNYGGTLIKLGYLKEGLEARERVHLLEPLVPIYARQRAQTLFATDRADEGLSEFERLILVNRGRGIAYAPFLSWAALAHHGRFGEAADALLQGGPSPQASGPFAQPLIEAAAQVMRAAASKSPPPAQLPDLYSEMNFVYAYTSTPERMLDWPEKAMKEGDYRPLNFIWWPLPSSVRKTERFKKLVRDAGLVDYWRARGWPDLCKPVGASDFACE
jgi:TolB-like protein